MQGCTLTLLGGSTDNVKLKMNKLKINLSAPTGESKRNLRNAFLCLPLNVEMRKANNVNSLQKITNIFK